MASVADDKNRDLPVDRPESGRWASRPWLARSVRVAVVLLPFVTATMVAITLSARLPVPANIGWAVLRVAFVAVIAALVYRGAEKYVRRALPLASLLDLSLRFPDRAPSRLAMAMRVASTEDLSFLLDRYRQVGASEPAQAAEHLLELVAALSKHDRVTRGHSERVRAYTQMIGQQLGLSGVELDRLRWAGLIHDIGKLRIDADILNKPSRLTDEEFEIIKTHPALGAELAAPLAGWLGDSVLAVAQHHERWDGRGYPLGLSGTEISYAARIVSVADTFDVITSIRSYRQAASTKDAAAELARCAGTQFDPAIVRAFLALPLVSVRRVMGPLSWLMSFLSGPSTWLPSWGGVGSSVGSGVSSSAAATAGSSSAVVGVGAVTGAAAVSSVAAGATVVGAGAAMSTGVGMVISLSLVSGVIATGIGTVAAMQPTPDAAVVPSAPPAAEVTLETVPPSLGDEPIVVTTEPPPVAEQMGPIPPVTTVPIVAVEVPPVVVVPVTSAAPRLSAEVPQTTPTTTAPPTTAPPTTAPPTTVVPAPTTTVAPPPPSQAAPIPAAPTERSFTVAVSSPGAGTVLSAPEGIECASTCTGSFLSGSTVSLTAVPATGWNFIGWTSSCQSAGSSTCTVTMSQSRSTTALFARAAFDLTVNKQGSGTVSSSDGSLTCGAGCSSSVVPMTNGSTVTLTATPADGWAIDSWSSSCADVGAASTCTLSMSQARSTTVWFTRASYDITVVSNGQGIVTSDLGGLECGAQCSATVPSGQSVVLTAVPDEGWKFAGWTSSCVAAGTSPTCSLVADADRSTSAFFVPAAFAFTALTNGAGSVTAEVDGEACDTTCLAGVDNGATVVLTATPADGWAFVGWTSSCLSAGSSPTCTVVADGERSTMAMFAKSAFDLTVNKQGAGTITASSGGLECGDGCTSSLASVTNGESVTLTATPTEGWKVGSWSSACEPAGDSSTCTISMSQDRSTTVWFVRTWFEFTVNTSGSGSVAASVAGEACDADCLARVDANTEVTLTAAPADGWSFTGWSGSCGSAGSDPACVLTASTDRSTTASFTKSAFDLTVNKQGSGSVSSSVGGLDCGAGCSTSTVPVANGESVTLTATPAAGWMVGEWSNDACTDGAVSCTFTMSQDRSTSVWFTKSAFAFTVNASGPGSVSASIDGVACDAACLAAVPAGKSVTLTAVPGANSALSGWSSSCASAGSDPTCVLVASADRSTTASFVRTAYVFTVNRSGSAGSVSASIDGVPCDAVCLAAVPAGKSVTFLADPGVGSAFTMWSGACSAAGSDPTCVTTASADRTVGASFVAQTVKYTVQASGPGSVSASIGGVACDATCLQAVPRGATVTLTAAPAARSALVGWSSSCESAGVATTCVLSATNDRATTATFQQSFFDVSVGKQGAGVVTSSLGGLDCGSVCTVAVARDGSVTLTASPSAGWRFDSWQNACSGAGASCVLSMSQDRIVTAKFVPLTFDLSVSKQGSGTVTSSSGGLSCGSLCTVPIAVGATVVLTATPPAGFTFEKWTGACTGTGTTCQVIMSEARDVTVWFSPLLTLSKQGSGTVTSNVGGMNCGAGCTGSVVAMPVGASVTLTATPELGFAVDKWSNGCEGATTTCTLTMSQAQSTTVWFVKIPTLTVNKQGSGTVTSSVGGMNCGAGCSSSVVAIPGGVPVTITATPAEGWSVKWGKACPNPGTATATSCTVSSTWSVTVFFSPIVTVTKSAGGTVTSSDGAINCGAACSAGVTASTKVTLTATPDAGMKFTGWSGACTGTAPTCTLTVQDPAKAANLVTANFAPV